ncbi:MAG: ABC transporter substrate-binding protein [Thermomicrobiales bacterium]|nr:ABC transporter substrate-binding protein [Thermomicrobiales bacterium]
MNRRKLVASVGSAVAAAAMGRSALAQTPESASGETREFSDSQGVKVIPVNPQRVLSLGEELLLADLLVLGIKPVMASGNYPQVFVGIDPALTEGLTPFSLWEMNIEDLILAEPDLILLPENYYPFAPDVFDTIAELAPLVMLPTTTDWQSDFRFIASVFGLESLAEEKITEIEDDIVNTRELLQLEGQTVTFASIYPGATDVTLWLTDQAQILNVAAALDLTIVPDAADYQTDQIGRVWISFERSNEITGETLIMLQTTGGISMEEEASYEEYTTSQAWSTLPAVQNDRVFVIERVGHPGMVPGRRSLLAEYRRIFGE